MFGNFYIPGYTRRIIQEGLDAWTRERLMTPRERVEALIDECLYVPEGGHIGEAQGAILRAWVNS